MNIQTPFLEGTDEQLNIGSCELSLREGGPAKGKDTLILAEPLS